LCSGVATVGRVKLLLHKGQKCYRPRRTGERKRKSVRGCIVNHNLSVLNLVIVKKGEGEIPGLTDKSVPRRLGPKRANNIRKLFALDKSDPVTSYVVRRTIEKEGKKAKKVAPRVQRLITPVTVQRKRHRIADKVCLEYYIIYTEFGIVERYLMTAMATFWDDLKNGIVKMVGKTVSRKDRENNPIGLFYFG